MTGEQLERAIEFLLDQDAKLSIRVDALTAAIEETKAIQRQQGERLEQQGERLEQQGERLERIAEEMREGFKSLTEEMREGFNNLIIANEVTRKLAEDVARLAIQTSQRVTTLESKLQ
jgi:hypothetical protein